MCAAFNSRWTFVMLRNPACHDTFVMSKVPGAPWNVRNAVVSSALIADDVVRAAKLSLQLNTC